MAVPFAILLRLNKVDVRLAEIKARAANLDAGQSVKKAMEALRPEFDAKTQLAHRLKAELKDTELHQRTLQDKIDAIEKTLYSGKVVNSREVEAYQKEQEMFRRQKDEAELKALELMDQVPPAEAEAKAVQAKMAELQAAMKKKYEAAVAEKAVLEKEYREAAAARNELAKQVDAGALKEYEAVRNHGNGIAIAEITDVGTCGMCGTQVPRKSIEAAKEDRRVSCENCHRWLYAPILKVDS